MTHERPNSHKSGPVAANERRPRLALSSSDPPRLHLASTLPRLGFVGSSLPGSSSPQLLSSPLLASAPLHLRSSSPRLCVLRLLLASAPQLLGASRKKNPARRCESRCESGSATCAGLAAGQAGPACGTASTDDGDAAATLAVPIIVPIETIEKLLPRGPPHARQGSRHNICIYDI